MLCILLLTHASLPAIAQQLSFSTYGSAEGLPQSQVHAITEDSQGYIWIGTYAGISRFNGFRFESIDTSSGLLNNTVNDLEAGPEGTLYIATLGGGVTIKQGDSYSYLTADDNGLVNNNVYDILLDGDTLWIATELAVTRYRNGTSRHYQIDQGLDVTYANALHIDRDGTLWLGSDLGLHRLADNRFQKISLPDYVEDPLINCLADAPDGSILIGLDQHLLSFDGNSFLDEGTRIGLDTSYIYSLTTHEGDLWIGSAFGIFQFTDSRLHHYGTEHGLVNQQINRILQDSQGNLWFGTEEGLSRYSTLNFVYYTTEDGLPSSDVYDLLQLQDGRILALTTAGPVYFRNGTGSLIIEDIEAVAGITGANTAVQTSDGTIYIGTDTSLIRLLPDGTRTRLQEEYGVTFLFADSRDHVWVGSTLGVTRIVDDVLEDFAWDSPLSNYYINCISEDSAGRIWIGTTGSGCIVYDDGNVVVYGRDEGLSNQDIWSIAPGPERTMWIGTNGDGAFHWDGKAFHAFGRKQGLSNLFIWQVLPEPDGTVWFGTNVGIDKWDGSTMRTFTTSDGLAANEGYGDACILDANGNAWFASGKGLSRTLNNVPERTSMDLPVYFESFRSLILGELSLNTTAELPPHAGDLSFRFVALNYENPKAVRYRYSMSGIQEKWSDPTENNNLNFAAIAPGSYSMKVQASIDGGNTWSNQTPEVSFIIHPPFYDTAWFRGLVILLIVTLVFGVHQLRVRRVEQTRRHLESIVKERTEELFQSNQQLQLTVARLEEANSDLQAFSVSVSHDLRSPLNRISSYAGFLSNMSVDEYETEGPPIISRIRRNCTRMNELINDLLKLAQARDAALNKQRVSIAMLAREVMLGFSAERNERNIDFHVEEDEEATGDPKLLKIVLENLIHNAVKFTARKDQAQISIISKRLNGKTEVTIRDNGAGFPSELSDELFKHFSRLHSEKEFIGTGIGLSTVRHIIERHDGSIKAEGKEGEGAVFTFTLPDETEN